MKHLLVAIALLVAADLAFRQGQGVHAVVGGVAALGHGIGAWVFYGAPPR